MRIKPNKTDAKRLSDIVPGTVVRDDDGALMLVTAMYNAASRTLVQLDDGEDYAYPMDAMFPVVDGAFVEGA